MSFLEEFAENIKKARQDKGLTQRQLAQQVGITANAISLYENAKRMPSLEITSIMSNILDVSLDDLIPYAVHEMPVDQCQTCIFDLIGEKNV